MFRGTLHSIALWTGTIIGIFLAYSWIYSVQSSYRFALGHNPYAGLDAWGGQLRLTLRYEPKMEFDAGAPVQFTTGSSSETAVWFAKPFYYHRDPDYAILTLGVGGWLASSGFVGLWVLVLLVTRKSVRRKARDGWIETNIAEQGGADRP
jgi:4-amino-4-deoxy-L-arabinose transferase-like glycosyltransferase